MSRRFKNRHNNRFRRVMKYVSSKDKRSFEDTLQATELFQKQTNSFISTFNLDYVINTDQSGCEYHAHTSNFKFSRRKSNTSFN